jgi:hypothetical protein
MPTTLTADRASTLTLTLELTPDEQRRVAEASRRGIDLSSLLRGLISGLPASDTEISDDALERLTLDDILASVDAYSSQTEETDESIGAFADAVVTRHRQERP